MKKLKNYINMNIQNFCNHMTKLFVEVISYIIHWNRVDFVTKDHCDIIMALCDAQNHNYTFFYKAQFMAAHLQIVFANFFFYFAVYQSNHEIFA